jgi:hypothetical protein
MNPPTLPASPWQAFPLPDSRAIATGDGHFLLNLERLDSSPETVAALKRAVAALPDLLKVLERTVVGIGITDHGEEYVEISREDYQAMIAALFKAGYTATVPQTTETPAP